MKFLQKRRGAALVEYGLLIAGVALIAAAAVSIFGHKTSDMMSAVAAVLPGAHDDDAGPIVSGKIIDTTKDADGNIILDVQSAADGTNTLGDNTGLTTPDLGETLVVEAGEE
ncbi:MAG: hypothetical protein ACF8XB_25130 [Planctomycetota bacterium JB042]